MHFLFSSSVTIFVVGGSVTMKQMDRNILLDGVIISALLNATGQIFFKAVRAAYSDASLLSLLSHGEV